MQNCKRPNVQWSTHPRRRLATGHDAAMHLSSELVSLIKSTESLDDELLLEDEDEVGEAADGRTGWTLLPEALQAIVSTMSTMSTLPTIEGGDAGGDAIGSSMRTMGAALQGWSS